MLQLLALQTAVTLLTVADCRVLEGLQRYSSVSTYLPVDYQVLNADSAFFLKEADQDFMRNSSLTSRTEPFFIYRARSLPSVSASYGPLSLEQPVPLELLQGAGTFPASSVFTFNWKVQTFVMNARIHRATPRVQVLFFVAGRDWDDYGAVDELPCVHLFAFRETQEVRGSCQLKGELALCVAELEPLASWFGPPSVVPGRQRSPEGSEGTPVELYYTLQSTELGGCRSEEARKDRPIRSSRGGMFGPDAATPLRRIGGVRLHRDPAPPPLAEHRLDPNFLVMVPSVPVSQRESVSAFISASAHSPVEMFTLRVKLKEGVAFLGERPSNPTQWIVSQDVRSEGHRVVTLRCRRKESGYDRI
ncbi:transmembrane protein 132C-like, partial [Brachionichthys hirsutus]|uniref:transmembrane protein 132C-like n=1 Tax=Brachionichthys hirsutus TaxID=412623 RepID=UPI0036048444